MTESKLLGPFADMAMPCKAIKSLKKLHESIGGRLDSDMHPRNHIH